jgi:hypothetical protein
MKICPACRQVIPEKGKRTCSLCHQTIKRTEKWQFGADSRAQHHLCPPPPLQPTPDLAPPVTSDTFDFLKIEG